MCPWSGTVPQYIQYIHLYVDNGCDQSVCSAALLLSFCPIIIFSQILCAHILVRIYDLVYISNENFWTEALKDQHCENCSLCQKFPDLVSNFITSGSGTNLQTPTQQDFGESSIDSQNEEDSCFSEPQRKKRNSLNLDALSRSLDEEYYILQGNF